MAEKMAGRWIEMVQPIDQAAKIVDSARGHSIEKIACKKSGAGKSSREKNFGKKIQIILSCIRASAQAFPAISPTPWI